MLKRGLRMLVRFYQMAISPYLPGACRFVPTCSEYALEALERYGAAKAMYLIFRRVLRCHPWGGKGYDPVP
jgi:putative membrane protein insertion efficiency factor